MGYRQKLSYSIDIAIQNIPIVQLNNIIWFFTVSSICFIEVILPYHNLELESLIPELGELLYASFSSTVWTTS